MKIFLKIGLLWATSLGLVFYLGLSLGTSDQNKESGPQSLPSSSIGAQTDSSINHGQAAAKTADGQSSLKPPPPRPVTTPPGTPNLQRILQGGDIVDRLGT